MHKLISDHPPQGRGSSMKKTVLALIFLSAPAAFAQQLTPKDYSPTDEAAIRTISIKGSGRHHYIVVAVANRGKEPFNSNFACTLLDKQGNAFATASGTAQAVPPGQEVVAESMSFEHDAAGAACRIQLIVPAG
jgi:hypothetical protein